MGGTALNGMALRSTALGVTTLAATALRGKKTTPPRERTNTCKNITFPQLRLRAVNIRLRTFCAATYQMLHILNTQSHHKFHNDLLTPSNYHGLD